jgi:hypothetical protein
MVSKDTSLPYDKTRLNKQFQSLDYGSLQLRDEDWYKQNGVNFMLGREVVYGDNRHGSPYVQLEDGLKLVSLLE